jgi:hypothetical protein
MVQQSSIMDRQNPPSYFHDATVEIDGVTCTLGAEECLTHQNALNYWHGAGEPSSWLAVDIFQEARRRTGDGQNDAALELAAKALGITVDALRTAIEWHENYMRWHDGDPDYSVL